jgi:crossover junction endodeoxyribonuclease RuvC
VSPAKGTPESRLAAIYAAVDDAIRTHAPKSLAIETLFFSTNKKTALAVAEARGAVLACAGAHALPVLEFSPGQVKLAVTGHGAADKSAIARMIPHLITLPTKKRKDDELDAIAIAIAGLTNCYPQST